MTIAIERAFAELGRLRAAIVGDAGYALAYGSHAIAHTTLAAATGSPRGSRSESQATARCGSRSEQRADDLSPDLDVLFVGAALLREQLEQLVAGVVDLHVRYRLRLDTEVAHEVKVSASLKEVDDALALRGFDLDAEGGLRVPPVVVAPQFLNSQAFKLRLILNALTSPHVFLGGNWRTFAGHRAAAERAITLVGISLLDDSNQFTTAQAAAALVISADGANGEDFLGYKPGPALYSTVGQGLAHLCTQNVVTSVDGVTFRQHPRRRRLLVRALYSNGARNDPTRLGQ